MTRPDPLDAASAMAGGPTTRTLFDTRAHFHHHLQDSLARAQREIWLADRDFVDWPLNTEALATALQTFLRQSPANHLRMLTRDADGIAARAPRFMQVVKPHAINAQCRLLPPHASSRFDEACSMAIVDRSLLVRRFHRDRPRGAAEFDLVAARPWLDQLETLWEESTPALASTTLGLG